MVEQITDEAIESLRRSFDGEILIDELSRILYSTDASVYRQKPFAVSYPGSVEDIRRLVHFASDNNVGIIPRAAGTSLAGQVVGSGIVADLSRYFTKILELNTEEKWVRLQPGVVPDELNAFLRPYGLLFGPETSTSNRCNLGGMTGNNGCGLHSLVYGSVRDHIIEARVILSDGSEALFREIDTEEYREKLASDSKEGDIYRAIDHILSDGQNLISIADGYPEPSVQRRNTGYALDVIAGSKPFDSKSSYNLNLSKLIAGSEGTLAIVTELKLGLVPLPPPVKALSCVHLHERRDAFRANLIALDYNPQAVEMMDDKILKLSEKSPGQLKNRFFIEGTPGAIVIVEFCADTMEEITAIASEMEREMRSKGLGYAFPLVSGSNVSKVWNLRKAGLGVLSNMKGDAKPLSLIEDCAVNVHKLGDFVDEIEDMLRQLGKESVYHAHIATGELHIRPVLNIKDPAEVGLMRIIAEKTARIVKKYRGSMSGEHGDGRLRGEFIPIVIGSRNYELNIELKRGFDPQNIFNPGKITDTPPMDESLRYIPGKLITEPKTWFDFSSSGGFIRAAEKCNGSGDCRKSVSAGGTMCPTFMATSHEKMTTRARANTIREIFNTSSDPWADTLVYEVLDNCLACKGCKSECPSEVDMAKLKSEFLQHWNDIKGVSLRTWLIAHLPHLNSLLSPVSWFYNFFASNRLTSLMIKKITGFAKERSIPLLAGMTLRKWIKQNLDTLNPRNPVGEVYLFIDEFTNYNDTSVGIAAIRLLTSLNYKIITISHPESARTFISKGFLRKARKTAEKQVAVFSPLINSERPLIGLEPSAILGFRDEYPDLVRDEIKMAARELSHNVFLFEEFIINECRKGNICSNDFTEDECQVLVHVHCQQKAVSSSAISVEALSIPRNYHVREILSGCCGMAGAFGYEKEHYDLAMKIGEMVLFPEVRDAGEGVVISAPGTSCRHHVRDGTGRQAKHPAEVLFEALNR